MLIEEGVRSGEQIASDLCLSIPELESLGELSERFVKGQKDEADPALKPARPRVVPFRRD